MLPTIGPYLLPQVALRIRRKLPRLDLLLYEYQTGPMLEHLHAGDIDVGILALPVPADGMQQRELYEEPFVVAAPESHELAKRKSEAEEAPPEWNRQSWRNDKNERGNPDIGQPRRDLCDTREHSRSEPLGRLVAK